MEKLLKETEGYLQKLGVKLQKQKELAKLENDFSESNSVMEVAIESDAKDNTQVPDIDPGKYCRYVVMTFDFFSDSVFNIVTMYGILQHYLESNENYYSQAHRWVVTPFLVNFFYY